MLPRRLDQRGKQPEVPGLLGMPLHAHHETPARELHRLDDPVIRPGGGRQPVGQHPDGLVVAAQHVDLGPHDGRRARARDRAYRDLAEGPGPGLVDRRPHHVGEVLDQVPAQVDVEQLMAPADGEDREVGPQGRRQQGAFGPVTHRVDPADAGVGVLTEGGGVDVPPADQDQTVEGGHHLVGARLGAPVGRVGRREEERPAPGPGHEVDVGGRHQHGVTVPRPTTTSPGGTWSPR